MNKVLLLIAVFSLGYVVNDILRENNIELVNKVYADVAGMNQFQLQNDYAFKNAVENIIENYDFGGRYSLTANSNFKSAVEAVIAQKLSTHLSSSDIYDFKSAVEDIVEDCDVNIDAIGGPISCGYF